LPSCYEAQFGTLTVEDTGVPLEHLVSCLPGIEIYQGVGCVKYLRWLKSKGNEDVPVDGELQILLYCNAWISVYVRVFLTSDILYMERGVWSVLWLGWLVWR
jgi:hypothetical protein